jgi:hypothetical protein
MTEEIKVLGETFESVIVKAVGQDFIARGNVRWPEDQRDIEGARDFHIQAVPSPDDVRLHRPTAADYQFTKQKGYILGPPQDDDHGTREDWIKRGYVGVYRDKMFI